MSPNQPARGSSPRMRGAHSVIITEKAVIGIIPADAGSTRPCRHDDTAGWDHPRGCGEHATLYILAVLVPGSSPRMRGARTSSASLQAWDRIIPADAGSTWQHADATRDGVDHPRGCGEHRTCWHSRAGACGSSPRMRGALQQSAGRAYAERIIPADAGSTGSLGPISMADGDHPRGCGEHREHG